LNQSSSTPKSRSTLLIVSVCIGWAIFSLLFFILFGARVPGEEAHPEWYLVGINFLEIVAFSMAALLCFRNAGSAQILSGRSVWLPMGLGMLFYTLGNVLFALWGTVWGLDPAVSLGDFFYLLSYIFLFIGMFQAVLPRRLELTPPQWLMIIGLAALGVGLAFFVNYQVAVAAEMPVAQVASVQVEQSLVAQADSGNATVPETPAPPETDAAMSQAPGWVIAVDQQLAQYEDFVGLLYVIADSFLVVMAAALLVAFWGGRFSKSWILIAIAAFFLYLADILFAFDLSRDAYVEGAVWEVFWTLSAIFFGLGAAVEYEISAQSRRGSRRRG
jgi:hypothetical protein